MPAAATSRRQGGESTPSALGASTRDSCALAGSTWPPPDDRARSLAGANHERGGTLGRDTSFRAPRAAADENLSQASDCADRRPKGDYSHSITTGFCMLLIRLKNASHDAAFTVRNTVTSSRIPEDSFHHRSTSIGDSRQVHDGHLSRSIDTWRLRRRLPSPSARARVGRGSPREGPASNTSSPCPTSASRQEIYRQGPAGPWVRMMSPAVAGGHANSATTVESYAGAASRGDTLRAMSSRVVKVFRS